MSLRQWQEIQKLLWEEMSIQQTQSPKTRQILFSNTESKQFFQMYSYLL